MSQPALCQYREPDPVENRRQLEQKLEHTGPGRVLAWGWRTFGHRMVLGTGFGSSGMVLIHLLDKLGYGVPVFYLDTHLLFPETYKLRREVERRFKLEFTRVSTDLSLESQAEIHGDKLWERDPDRCCHLRKVLPLRDYLADKRAWITGLRRGQHAGRRGTPVVTWDRAHGVVKINPLAGWSDEDVWDYIEAHKLPYNPLHDEGYPSIGCIPCTRPVEQGEGARAGRWSGTGKTECGIHRTGEDLPGEETGGPGSNA